MATGTIQKNMVLLWTNPNPTATFAAQTVQVDLSGYNIVGIICMLSKDAQRQFGMALYTNPLTEGRYLGFSGNQIAIRYITSISDSGIAFATCEKTTGYGTSSSSDNNSMIPYKIFGFKA